MARHPYLLWLTGLVFFRSLGAPLSLLLPGAGDVPPVVVGMSLVMAAVVLVGLRAIWQGRRWGAWLVIVLAAIDVLSALPAFFAPDVSGWMVGAAAVGVLTGIAVIVLARQRAVWGLLN